MEVGEIPKTLQTRPFKAFEIHVDNGEKYLITQRENIIVTDQIVMTVDDQAQAVLITPESSSTICIVNGKT